MNEDELRMINDHTYFPSIVDIQAEKVNAEARVRAEETLEPPNIIINKCLENISVAGMMRLPNRNALRKLIRRKRKEIY